MDCESISLQQRGGLFAYSCNFTGKLRQIELMPLYFFPKKLDSILAGKNKPIIMLAGSQSFIIIRFRHFHSSNERTNDRFPALLDNRVNNRLCFLEPVNKIVFPSNGLCIFRFHLFN